VIVTGIVGGNALGAGGSVLAVEGGYLGAGCVGSAVNVGVGGSWVGSLGGYEGVGGQHGEDGEDYEEG